MSKLFKKASYLAISLAISAFMVGPVQAKTNCRTDARKIYVGSIKSINTTAKDARKTARDTLLTTLKNQKGNKDAIKQARDAYKTELKRIKTDHNTSIKSAQRVLRQAKEACKTN